MLVCYQPGKLSSAQFVAAAIRNSPLLYECQSAAPLPKKFALKLSSKSEK